MRPRSITSGITLMLVFSALLVLGAPAAHAISPTCGDVIVGGSNVLDSDMSCTTSPALTLQGSTLDMDGHTISSDGTQDCVHMTGSGSVLRNGTVSSCLDGVTLVGTGDHIVSEVTAEEGTGNGFDVATPDNIIRDSQAISNASGAAFRIDGNGNLVFRNRSKGNDAGFAVFQDNNTFWSNTSTEINECYFIEADADGNTYAGNVASKCGAQGFAIQGDANSFLLNTASKVATSGFVVAGGDNTLGGNKALKNGGSGIALELGALTNRIYGNTAKGNADTDLNDASGGCVSNDWEGNSGKTNLPCTNGHFPAAPVLATPACGDTLSGGDFFLKANIGPCTEDPALTLDGATLDMRKKSVKGNGSNVCVSIIGTPSLLHNGSVSECNDAVSIPTTGGHIVRKLKVKNVGEDTFEIIGDNNIVHSTKSVGSNHVEDGASDNFLFKNKVKNGVIDVIGDTNVLWSNATTKAFRGFVIDEDSDGGNILVGNKAVKSVEQGFQIRDDSNVLLLNIASKNGLDGFDVVPIPDNGANLNLLGGNKALKNKERGIVLSGAVGNTAVGNTALKNKVFDLQDQVDDCVANTWEGNRFKTDNPDCIT